MTKPAATEQAAWEIRLLAVVVATLAVFGVAAVYGASSIVAVQNGRAGSAFALNQLVGLMVGGVVFLAAAKTDYHLWERLAWPLIGLCAAALAVPYLPVVRSLAPEINGARRWVDIGRVRFQPSELAKFAVVAWTAMLAAKKGDTVREFRRGVMPFLVIVGPLSALVLFQPNLSTAAFMVLLAGVILFAAGARIGHFLLLGLAAVPIAWHEIVSVQYRLARMLTFLSPGQDSQEMSWQITQSVIGVGSGRVFGVGFGQGQQKLGYLPYAYSDFIFSTIGEEWGFVGICIVVLLYAVFIGLGLRIARTAQDAFGMLLATGLTTLIGMSALVHMAVSLALVPTTGLPLPFVSYGRSSLLVSLLAAGVLASVGRRRQPARPPAVRGAD
jgi:cell division protein FtsW